MTYVIFTFLIVKTSYFHVVSLTVTKISVYRLNELSKMAEAMVVDNEVASSSDKSSKKRFEVKKVYLNVCCYLH